MCKFLHMYTIYFTTTRKKSSRYFEETCVIGVTFALILNFFHNFFFHSNQNSIDIEVRICLEKKTVRIKLNQQCNHNKKNPPIHNIVDLLFH